MKRNLLTITKKVLHGCIPHVIIGQGKGVFKFSTNEYKARNYDQRLIRFPKGTIKKFRELFADDVPFNAWVVNLVTSRLLMTEEKKWSTKPPKM